MGEGFGILVALIFGGRAFWDLGFGDFRFFLDFGAAEDCSLFFCLGGFGELSKGSFMVP